MYPQQLNTKANRFGLILISVIVLFCVIGYAFFALKKKNAPINKENAPVNQVINKEVENSDAEAPVVLKTVNKDKEGLSFVSGRIVEIVEIPGTQEKRIKIMVNDIDKITQDAPDLKEGELSKKVNPSFKSFLFLLSEKDTEGAKDIKGGDFVTVTLQGEPSEKDYMVASKVEKK